MMREILVMMMKNKQIKLECVDLCGFIDSKKDELTDKQREMLLSEIISESIDRSSGVAKIKACDLSIKKDEFIFFRIKKQED